MECISISRLTDIWPRAYSSLTRYGARHIFVKPCVEVVYDIRGSLKAGKQTNQVIQDFDSVQIVAIHLRIVTQQSLQPSEYLMEWSGSLELPLQAAVSAFEALGLGDRLSAPAASAVSSGGETPLRAIKSGETPLGIITVSVNRFRTSHKRPSWKLREPGHCA